MIPQVVVFDLGKVLLDFDYGISAGRIAARSKVSPAEVQALIDHSDLLFRLERGEINNDEFFRTVCLRAGFEGNYEEFSGMFADIFSAIEPMVRLQARLRASQIPTFVFSNTNGIAISHIRRTFEFFANFNGYVFSYEHGAMKPDERVYQVVETTAGSEGEKILFLDDRKENVLAGKARGWQVIHHQSPEETIEEMKRIGLL